ncbi:MAG TPA: protein kinase [Thermoanaerobaculia bacterium]|nr:protein kinase [Thermoanaerobaculia bacterium]
MTPDPRLPSLFAEASELESAARAVWLAELRGKDEALAREVEELLAASAAGGRRFETPAWLRLPLSEGTAARPVPERVGPYRIQREIGRGGMGRVFLAEQEGAGFRRTVALKIIDRPVVTEDTTRRFRDEVRILAGLEHPGIARFYDAGRAEDGSWFLVLEYVEGEDLVAFVRGSNLDLRARIELFLQVLDAIDFAHRRRVVHRDLKPGNVLVGADGRARLLDFGISKIVDPDAEDPLATRTELRAFTPAYASPEQLRGERATTASDVYSLGAMLYELLAGVRPFVDATGSRAAFERAVLESDPDPPSTAARRLTAPPAGFSPAGGLGRDLDAICLKALRKEPGERYASAAAFAEDLQRYLAGRPVEARQGGRQYRLAKLVRRSRGRLATAAAIALAVAALLFAVQAERGPRAPAPPPPRPFPFSPSNLLSVDEARKRFDSNAASVEAGAELALALNQAGRSQEAEVIVARLRQIPGRSEDPLVDYVGASVASKKDEPQRALILFNRAFDHALAGGRGELVAQIRASRGRLFTVLGRNAEARAEMTRARADFAKAGDQASLARVTNDLAIEELQLGHLAEGERLLEAALAATRAASKENRGATMLTNLGVVGLARGRPDLAERRLREALQIRRQIGGPSALGHTLIHLAIALYDLGRPREAEPLYEEGVAVLRETSDAHTLGLALCAYGTFTIDRGEIGGSAAMAAESERSAQTSGLTANLGFAEFLRGYAAAARGDIQTARARLGQARRLFSETGLGDDLSVTTLALAAAEKTSGDPTAAARVAEELLQTLRQHEPDAHTFQTETFLAEVAAAQGRLADAGRHLAALGPGAEVQPSVPLRLGFLRARAELLRAEGRLPAARRDLETAISLAQSSERKLDELRLRLTLAEVDRLAGDSASARKAASGVAAEAARRGLNGIAAQARRLAADPPLNAGN